MKNRIVIVLASGVLVSAWMGFMAEVSNIGQGVILLAIAVGFGIGCLLAIFTQIPIRLADGISVRRMRALRTIIVVQDRLLLVDKSQPDYEEWRIIYEARIVEAMRSIRKKMPITVAEQQRLTNDLLLVAGHQSMRDMRVATKCFYNLMIELGAEVITEAVSP